jgi:hypothetical protein
VDVVIPCIASANDGLRAINSGNGRDGRGRNAGQGVGKFNRAWPTRTLASMFDQAFIVDETTDLTQAQPFEAQPYQDVMKAALGYLDEAITLSGGGSTRSRPRGFIRSR